MSITPFGLRTNRVVSSSEIAETEVARELLCTEMMFCRKDIKASTDKEAVMRLQQRHTNLQKRLNEFRSRDARSIIEEFSAGQKARFGRKELSSHGT